MLAASVSEASTCFVQLSGFGALLGSEIVCEEVLQHPLAFSKLTSKTWSFNDTRSATMLQKGS